MLKKKYSKPHDKENWKRDRNSVENIQMVTRQVLSQEDREDGKLQSFLRSPVLLCSCRCTVERCTSPPSQSAENRVLCTKLLYNHMT